MNISAGKNYYKSHTLRSQVVRCWTGIGLGLCLNVQIFLGSGIESALLPLETFSGCLIPLTYRKLSSVRWQLENV